MAPVEKRERHDLAMPFLERGKNFKECRTPCPQPSGVTSLRCYYFRSGAILREVRESVRTRYVALMRKQRLSASFTFSPVILPKMRAMGISILDR